MPLITIMHAWRVLRHGGDSLRSVQDVAKCCSHHPSIHERAVHDSNCRKIYDTLTCTRTLDPNATPHPAPVGTEWADGPRVVHPIKTSMGCSTAVLHRRPHTKKSIIKCITDVLTKCIDRVLTFIFNPFICTQLHSRTKGMWLCTGHMHVFMAHLIAERDSLAQPGRSPSIL